MSMVNDSAFRSHRLRSALGMIVCLGYNTSVIAVFIAILHIRPTRFIDLVKTGDVHVAVAIKLYN